VWNCSIVTPAVSDSRRPARSSSQRACAAIAAVEEAEQTVRSLAWAGEHTLEWGFIASPPMPEAPELFAAFVGAHPNVDNVPVSLRELTGSPARA
jgi:hypothetical protein